MANWLTRLVGYWLGRKSAGRDQRTSSFPARPFAPSSRFDAARTGPQNREHWAWADALSPNATVNHADRKIIRQRARYEVGNNAFAFGAANSIAEDCVGTGPRLSLIGLPEAQAQAIETSFATWADQSGFAETLRLLFRSMVVDGESFAMIVDNPRLQHPVRMQLVPFEADRVTDPAAFVPTARLGDGIDFDQAGNPVRYTVLRQHPGDQLSTVLLGEWDVFPASQIYHLFRPDRPGQARGVSWLTPALELFAQLRRYTTATLLAAETAANIAGILKTDQAPAGDDESATPDSMDEIATPRNTLLTLPPGWDVSQLKAEQPTQTFGDFRTQILLEIGRTIDMPLNRITGNSSGYNFSSGRLDHMGYHRSLWQHRDRLIRLRLLDRLFPVWLDEAILSGAIPPPPQGDWSWEWQWDAFGDIDPVVEADAAEKLLNLNLTDLAEQCAARGRRWDQVLRQRAREKELMRELGLDSMGKPAQPANPPVNPPPTDNLQTQEVGNAA